MTPSQIQNQTAETKGYAEEQKSPRVDKVRRIFAEISGRKKVLDVGCASGAILKPFATAHEIHGVDISASLVRRANESGIHAVEHDLETGPLPYPDKSFDLVFCGETIEHHVDTDWLISEINRVLKPGGQLVLTYPNIRTPLGVFMMLVLDLPPMYAARYRSVHFRDFTKRVIRIVLGNHHFEVNRIIGSSFYVPKIGECCAFLATFLPSWANTAIVVATKSGDSRYNSEDTYADRIY